jgi:hypothetical protein
MESLSQHPHEVPRSARRTGLPMDIGEAVMASIGSDYSDAPLSDEYGVRASIPGHPEIVAYKLRGGPGYGRTVDDLIELDRRIKAQEVAEKIK